MTRINLLPWREELREEKQKEFVQYLVFVLLVAGGLVFVGGQYVNGGIEDQKARNGYIRREIAVLDERISEIRDLQQRRRELLARMQVIQDLQGNRPVIVRIFDQLVRTLSKGVFYNQLSVRGRDLSVTGIAESNNRISELMRNLDGSEWFTNPNLRGLREAAEYGDQASVFDLTFQQTLPNRGEEEQ
jgi:type IV pilus assembly protein PilN